MPKFAFDGLSIAYDDAGSGDPVLFLHNLGGSRAIWQAQSEALASTHRVLALDWFGYGDSSIPTDGYTVERHLRLLESFVREQALTNLTLVGNCFGSAMALQFARRHPETVHALVLVNPLTAATLAPTTAGLAARLLRRAPLGPIAERLRLPGPVAGLVVREQLGRAASQTTSDLLTGIRERWTESRRLVPLAAILPELPSLAELDELVPDAGFPPITTVWGEQNRVLSADAGRRLDQTLKPQSAVRAPDCGHLVMIEDPATVTAAVVHALAESAAR